MNVKTAEDSDNYCFVHSGWGNNFYCRLSTSVQGQGELEFPEIVQTWISTGLVMTP